MSFSPDVFRKKLDSLQDTQELIVSISQWVLFHHRHAKDLCELWSNYAVSNISTMKLNKKLSLLYLCNDVVQEARHKRKPEFSTEFARILPDVLNAMYPTLDSPVKPKVERLIGVWEQRNIFDKQQIKQMRRSVELLKSGMPNVPEVDDAPVKSSTSVQIAPELVHLNNLYLHLNLLQDVCLSNLSQVGFQLKTYLPHDHSALDNLPLPKVYISKLNVLEKLCNLTTQNLHDIKSTRQEVTSILSNLQNLLNEGATTDESKVKIILQKMDKLKSTRSELQEMLDEPTESGHTEAQDDEDESPMFESNADSASDLVPTYESSSDDDDEPEKLPAADTVDVRPVRKRKLSDSSISSNTSKKSVAFSEDIQIKEYDREEHTEVIKIVRSDTESEDDYAPDFEEPPAPENLREFEAHHKDDLELMHERLSETESDGYDPSGEAGDQEDPKAGLLSLLSKLN
ncbi:CIC11C00000005680 [Sungouiella intermedia]|uniref:CIC11C00000005680 n=1 Tax=Sungouiella intermedia TaxID=45354 RepID=A0A1L0C071_9ASCO|nr:CIC11C00000005680 [[Candida] intermedia]